MSKRSLTIRLSSADYEWLEAEGERRQVSISGLVREIVRMHRQHGHEVISVAGATPVQMVQPVQPVQIVQMVQHVPSGDVSRRESGSPDEVDLEDDAVGGMLCSD